MDQKRLLELAGLEEAESKTSTSMTGQPYEFAIEDGKVDILHHHKVLISGIPLDNWDALVRAYNRTKGKE